LQNDVEGLNYIPSLEGDKNMNIGDEKVEIPLRSSTNKPMKKPYVGGVRSLGAKVSQFFFSIIPVACSFIFLFLGFKLQLWQTMWVNFPFDSTQFFLLVGHKVTCL
jgi:hypothetical protein